MYWSPSQFFGRDGLIQHLFNDIGTCNKHITGCGSHKDKVGECRGINGAACCRTHDHRYLGNDPGGQYIAAENTGISGQTGHSFLYARSSRIDQAYNRRTCFQGHILYFYNFGSVYRTQWSSLNIEVLWIGKYLSAVYISKSGNNSVSIGTYCFTERGGGRWRISIDFLEGAFIKKKFYPFPGCQFSAVVLFFFICFAVLPG